MSDRETLDVYDARAREYSNLSPSPKENQSLQAFIDALPQGGCVLDLGCGPGTWAGIMAQAGLQVEALDASMEMARLAAEKPGVNARQAGFDDVTGTDIYDGIWANFSLLHAKRDDLPRHLAALRQALKPGGLFHIGMKTGAGMQRDTIGRRYTYVSRDELAGLLGDAGLHPFREWSGEDKGLDGVVAPWIVIQARG